MGKNLFTSRHENVLSYFHIPVRYYTDSTIIYNLKTFIMTTEQVAKKLVETCRKGQVLQAGEELYSENIVSIEPEHGPMKSAKGKKAVLDKGAQLASMIEERHGGSFSEPIVNGNHFSVAMTLDATLKGMGRVNLQEICVYEVKEGKIVKEQFFFN
jgi:hypothetical protein